MEYSRYWTIEVDGEEMNVVFINRKDAIEFANKNVTGQYGLVRNDQYEGSRTKLMTASAK